MSIVLVNLPTVGLLGVIFWMLFDTIRAERHAAVVVREQDAATMRDIQEGGPDDNL